MNIGDSLSPSSTVDTQMAEPVTDLMSPYASVSTERSTGRKDSAVRQYATRTAANLRSIVERQFMRMSEAHDRIRTELLARHPPGVR
ncbi:MAG: hypothetical protein ACR2HX_17040 [Pyrinomonadaceae bacterium]